ncbi:MAG: Maf family protein [Dokdonella sp.]|uniref:Maf family protein n=1 Tax=Dokdonella sp. TaxID=2291710 RepID=UPI003F7D37BA
MTRIGDVDLVLGSTSRYRRELLARLTSSFRVHAPLVDETPRAGETPVDVAARLAAAKAQAVAAACPGAVVIGSDQVAELDGRALGKPGTPEAACAQLRACSGRRVAFHTALCVVDTRLGTWRSHAEADLTRVVFRKLHDDAIARYVEAERPLDCAGSFKAEGLGIALFERIENVDPTALIGLPLIALARLLRAADIELP